MNRATRVLVALLLLLACAPLYYPAAGAAAAPSGILLNAEGACIVDADGAIVYESGGDKRLPMASTTKTMTAVVALEQTDINRRVLVDVAWDEIPDSSIMGLDLMEELTIEELLYGLMLPSGNDAARAIARSIAGDDYRFAKLMTAKARELGLTNTQFKNPHGRDTPGHYTSACDLAQLGRYAMTFPEIRRIVATTRYTVEGRNGVYPMRNVNRFLTTYDGATGIKTGFDDLALNAIVASAERDGRTAYVALLRTYGDYATEAAGLMNYYFNDFPSLLPNLERAPGKTTLTPLLDNPLPNR
ncbi:MAG: D-alanyl-D-alanine carboxypeptidase family protein [Chloroflexota bacterium]